MNLANYLNQVQEIEEVTEEFAECISEIIDDIQSLDFNDPKYEENYEILYAQIMEMARDFDGYDMTAEADAILGL